MKQATMVKKVAVKSSAPKKSAGTSTAPFKSNGDLLRKVQEKAYQLYVERGYVDGYATEDWIKAEKIVRAS